MQNQAASEKLSLKRFDLQMGQHFISLKIKSKSSFSTSVLGFLQIKIVIIMKKMTVNIKLMTF